MPSGDYFLKFEPIIDCILETDRLDIRVIWSIITVTGVCAGLPALVWSVGNLTHHRKNGQRISVFIILLLLTDFVELFLSLYILINFFLNDIVFTLDRTFQVFWALLWASRDCGILLNQLVALEGILSLKYPLYTASVFSSSSFIIFYIFVFFCIFIGDIILDPLPRILIGLLMFIESVITWIISCGASCSADRHSHTSRKPDIVSSYILVYFIFSLLVFCLPFILLKFFILPVVPHLLLLWLIPSFLVSVRLISDPLLCVLVCRQNLRNQTSQNREGTSLVTSEMEI